MAETEDDLRAELERLRAENQALRTGRTRETRLQVSAKGGVSLYGIRRFPITFYVEEWKRILGMKAQIESFIAQHEDELKRKSQD
jgi:hypothetical protein